jgi:uncharacterized membrane protein YedE/YeeE
MMAIDLDRFSPLSATAGGVLIGLAASALLLFNGRIAGISGIVGSLSVAPRGDRSWRLLFVLGLAAGAVAALVLDPQSIDPTLRRPLPLIAMSGLLVGFGTRLANGCTSGHGVCGLSRFSKRSLVAVGVFMAVGMLTAVAARVALGRA